MINDGAEGCLSTIIGVGVIIIIIIMSCSMGATFSKAEHMKIGRNDGIKFCNEYPKECKYEYDYMQYLKKWQNKR